MRSWFCEAQVWLPSRAQGSTVRGATPRSRTSFVGYPHREPLGREPRAFRFEPGKSKGQAEFRDSHWLRQRRDISAEGWEEPGRGVSQRLAHPEPGEPEETNAGRRCHGSPVLPRRQAHRGKRTAVRSPRSGSWGPR
ncbi:hypothetical protein NN561_015060 [Cricetulus griseus]